MSALDEIRKKKNHELDAIERLIIEAWECLDGREWMSDDAAEELEALQKENELLRSGAQLGPIVGAEVIRKQEVELAALRRVFEAARKYITIVNNFCEQPGDEEEWLAALAEYDKCRAA